MASWYPRIRIFQDEAHVRCDALPKGREASTQRCRRCFTRGKFCGHHDVDRRQLVLREPEGLAHQAAQAIARDGIAGGFHRHGQADAGMRETIGFDAQPEEAVVDAPAAGVDRIELQLAAQAQLGAKALIDVEWAAWRPACRRAPASLGNDLLAALGAAARKNLFPARGLHAGAKTRGAFALDLARLISAFHDDRPKAADIPEKRAGRLRSGQSGCQYNPESGNG